MPTANIALYSANQLTREAVKAALGQRLAYGIAITVYEFAAPMELLPVLRRGGIDLLIADGESAPYGGMGVSRAIKNEIEDAPPVVLLVAREADAWLATWSRAEGIAKLPIEPFGFHELVATLLWARERGMHTPLQARSEPPAGVSSRH